MAADSDSEPIVKKLKFIHDLTGDANNPGWGAGAREYYAFSSGSSSTGGSFRGRKRDDSDEDEDFSESEEEEEPDDDSNYETDEDTFGSNKLQCHSCGQRSISKKVQCSRCPNQFCSICLRNRHGERLRDEKSEPAKWICPPCRGGCGPHCSNCCVCAQCRKSHGLAPTGPLVRRARAVGFTNVHDYLIHCQTGESPETVSRRKEGRGWIRSGVAISFSTYSSRREPSGRQEVQMQNTATFRKTYGPAHFGAESPDQDQLLDGSVADSTQNGKFTVEAEGMKMGARRPDPAEDLGICHDALMDDRVPAPERATIPERRMVPQKRMATKTRRASLDKIIERLSCSPKFESIRNQEQARRKPSMESVVIQRMKRNRRQRMLFRVTKRSIRGRHKDSVEDYGDIARNVEEVKEETYEQDVSTSRLLEQRAINSDSETLETIVPQQHIPVSPESLVPFNRPVTSLQALMKMKVLAFAKRAHAASDPLSQPSAAKDLPHKPNPTKSARWDVLGTSSSPSLDLASGLHAIFLRHQERRQKLAIRSPTKILYADTVKLASPMGNWS